MITLQVMIFILVVIMKKIKKITLYLLFFVFIFVLGNLLGIFLRKTFYFSFLPTYETPENIETVADCPLCSHFETDPPVIIDTNTGESRELRLYDYNIGNTKEISPKTHYGTMHMGGWLGGSFAAFPDNHYIHLSIQRDSLYKFSKETASIFFCSDCLTLIEELNPKTNYIFADCYDKENIKVYTLENILNTTIRHYSFKLYDKTEYLYSVEMHSSYFSDRKELSNE